MRTKDSLHALSKACFFVVRQSCLIGYKKKTVFRHGQGNSICKKQTSFEEAWGLSAGTFVMLAANIQSFLLSIRSVIAGLDFLGHFCYWNHNPKYILRQKNIPHNACHICKHCFVTWPDPRYISQSKFSVELKKEYSWGHCSFKINSEGTITAINYVLQATIRSSVFPQLESAASVKQDEQKSMC